MDGPGQVISAHLSFSTSPWNSFNSYFWIFRILKLLRGICLPRIIKSSWWISLYLWATLCTPGNTLGQKSTYTFSLCPLSPLPTQYIVPQPWILGRLCVYKLKVDVLLDLAFSSRLTHLSFHSDPETSSLDSVCTCSPPGLRTISTLPILPCLLEYLSGYLGLHSLSTL